MDLVRTAWRQLRAFSGRLFSSRLGIAAGIAVLTLVLAVGALSWARSAAESQVRKRLAEAIESRLGLASSTGTVEVGFGSLTIHDLRIVDPEHPIDAEPLATIDRIDVEFGVWAALQKRGEIESVVVDGLSANLKRDANGTFNFDPNRRPRSEPTTNSQRSASNLSLPRAVTIHNIAFHLDDQKLETVTNVSAQAANVLLSDIRELDLKTVEVHTTDANLNELLAANRGVDLSGRIDRTSTGLVLELRADYGVHEDGTDESFTMSGRIDGDLSAKAVPTSLDLDLRMQLVGVALKRANSLLKSTALAADDDATLTGMIAVRFPRAFPQDAPQDVASNVPASGRGANHLELSVELDAKSLSVFHPILARDPVTDLDVTTTFVAHLQTTPLAITISKADVQIGEIEMDLDLAFAAAAPIQGTARRLELRFGLPKSDCQELFSSMPQSLIPSLAGFELKGVVTADVDLRIDWSNFDATIFDHAIDATGCKVVRAPANLTAESLNAPFIHTVSTDSSDPGSAKNVRREILLGPKNPDYVALTDTSRALQRSLVYSEDPNFHSHVGFSRLLRDVLVKNLKQGRFAWGGSTITNQLVKNVFLRREKTLARKLQEYFLTWHLESTISKDRILELYVNAIEYGPNLYGLKPAARQYFDKSPDQLTTVESAFLSTLLPAPLVRYRQYCDDRLEKWTEDKLERIVDGLWTYKRLTEEEYFISLEQWVRFKGDKAALCGESDAVATR